VEYSSDSSLSNVLIDKFILLAIGFFILHIFAFYDMFHSLLFNFCTYIQTWKSILLKLKLKRRSFDKDNISIRCVILKCLIHILKVFFCVLLFHPFYFISFDLFFQGSHNITTMSLPTVYIVILIKLVKCFVTF